MRSYLPLNATIAVRGIQLLTGVSVRPRVRFVPSCRTALKRKGGKKFEGKGGGGGFDGGGGKRFKR
jgi:hypothetical protein